jgi:hypothetical protein
MVYHFSIRSPDTNLRPKTIWAAKWLKVDEKKKAMISLDEEASY